MNSKDLIVGIVVASIALAGGLARADLYTYDFDDTIEFFNDTNRYWAVGDSTIDGKLIVQGTDFSYQHDISDSVNFDAGHLVTDATLTLTFVDDEPDGGTTNNEITKVGLWDGSAWLWTNIGNVNAEQTYTDPDIDVSWLNNDLGLLGVSVGVVNNKGDVYLKQSTLSGLALVPIPAAVVLGGLGLIVAGWKLRRLV